MDVQNAITAVNQARTQYEAAVKGRVLQEQTLDADQKKLCFDTIFDEVHYYVLKAMPYIDNISRDQGDILPGKLQLDDLGSLSPQVNPEDMGGTFGHAPST